MQGTHPLDDYRVCVDSMTYGLYYRALLSCDLSMAHEGQLALGLGEMAQG